MKNPKTRIIKKLLGQEGNKITLQWVHSHVGNPGNEKADSAARHFLFYRFETNLRCSKDSKNYFETKTQIQRNHVYFGFRIIRCGLFPKPLKKGFFSLKKMTCCKKNLNQIRNKSTKIKQESLRFIPKDKLCPLFLDSGIKKFLVF
jgi:hypothetical protein